MPHAPKTPVERDQTCHAIPRAVLSSQAKEGASSRAADAPITPRVLANRAATPDVSSAMSQSQTPANARGAQKNDADFSIAPALNGVNGRGVSSSETAAPRVLAHCDSTRENDGADARAEINKILDVDTAAPRVLATDGATFNGDAALLRNAPPGFFIAETAPQGLVRDDSTPPNAADFRVENEGVSATQSAPDDATLSVFNIADARAASDEFPAAQFVEDDATFGFSSDGNLRAAPDVVLRVLVAESEGATLAPRAKSSDAREDGAPSLLEIGSQIGAYEVQAHLGDGGMASVYRVWHTGLHRVEALKVPRQQGRFGPEAAFLRRLLAEARTVANLQHPNIAAIYAISDAASPLQFFSMEFIEGGDLSAFLAERKSLAPSVALPILEQVAAALDYAHSQNVIHRDIKPANVLLQQSGENTVAKVVDFGISRANEEAGATRLTRSGMIVGTPEYMSPEQSGSGDDVTERTDQYSLGVLTYEMLYGAPPFVAGEGVSRLSLLMKHVGEAPQTPSHRVSGLPVTASDAIIKALSKKPEERFSSCREFVAALRAGLAGHDGIATASETLSDATPRHTRAFSPTEKTMEIAPPATPQRARLTALLAGVGGLVAGVLLVFGWLGYGNFPVKPMSLPATNLATPTGKSAREYSQITPRIVVQRETVKFQKVTRKNAALAKGVKRLVQMGRIGTREVRLEISVKNGVQNVRRGAAKTIVAPRAEIVEIGTNEESATQNMTPPESAPPKAASLSVALPKVALPPAAPPLSAPTNGASTRATQKPATPTVKRTAPFAKKTVKTSANGAAQKRAIKASSEKSVVTAKRVSRSPRKRRAPQRRAETRRRTPRASTAVPRRRQSVRRQSVRRQSVRRQRVKRAASTRTTRRSASRQPTRTFGGSEAGLPP